MTHDGLTDTAERAMSKASTMTKIPGKRADWMATSNTTSNISLSISPSTKLPEQELLYFALCNLSPYNPYCTSDPLDFGPPPARRLRKPPPPSFRAWCNLTPANPYDLPTMVSMVCSLHAMEGMTDVPFVASNTRSANPRPSWCDDLAAEARLQDLQIPLWP